MASKKEKLYADQSYVDMIESIATHYDLDYEDVLHHVHTKFPKTKDQTRCANCEASMQVYEFKLDSLNASLVLQMGKAVRRKIDRDGVTLTEANRVHVQSEIGDYSLSSRTTQCAKLGLITKVKEDGVHKQKEGWLITKRGFAFLRGESVPSKVHSFRNQITDRTEEMITMTTALKDRYSDYDPQQWVHIEKYQQGKLL